MSDTTDATTPWHEPIQAYRDRGGEPTDHPSLDILIEVACSIRWTDRERELMTAEDRLARKTASTDQRATSEARWTIELLSDRELADWFVEGLPDDVVEREEARAVDAWDKAVRPWALDVVVVREGFQCPVTGLSDRQLALRLTPRLAEDAGVLHLDLAAVVGVCSRGMRDLDAALAEALTAS